MMKVAINKRSGKHLITLDVSEDATVDDLKRLFYETCHFYPERQRYNIGTAKGAVLKAGTLAENGITKATAAELPLFFKDLGIQISWRLVFVLEYFGPLLIAPLLFFFPKVFYGEERVAASGGHSLTQVIAFGLMILHFVKRELESLFVHRFSNATMPLIRLPVNCTHYWILCGLFINYFVLHPAFEGPYVDPIVIYALAILMVICEVLNFRCHLVLRDLRPTGTRSRGIPKGVGFDTVSCANYLWETAAWVLFSLLTRCFTSWLFTVVAFVQMTDWALKKHRNYRNEFPDYPRSRKAIIPFLL